MIAVAAAVTIVLLTAVAASRSNASDSSPRTLQFNVAFRDVEVDLGEQGPSLGDERTFADSLLDANGREVGHDAGVCIFTSLTPPEAACHITFLLPGGQIATQFLNTPPPRKVAAIVGGTGTYRRARGEAVIVEGPNQTGTVTFRPASDLRDGG
jgi:hypothetical protein